MLDKDYIPPTNNKNNTDFDTDSLDDVIENSQGNNFTISESSEFDEEENMTLTKKGTIRKPEKKESETKN